MLSESKGGWPRDCKSLKSRTGDYIVCFVAMKMKARVHVYCRRVHLLSMGDGGREGEVALGCGGEILNALGVKHMQLLSCTHAG